MSEYITKEDAQDIIDRELSNHLTDYERVMIEYVINAKIGEISSADVMPVRHGRWLDKTQEPGWPVAECSVCGSHAGMFWMNYCPHCGARMDEKEEN